MNLDVQRFLEDVSGRYAGEYAEAITELLVGEVAGVETRINRARTRIGRVVNQTMGVAEVVGASLTLQSTAAAITSEPEEFSQHRASFGRLVRFSDQPILPRVTLTEAVDDMVARTPVVIRDAAQRTAVNIARLYSEGQNVAFVRSAEDAVTREAQAFINRALSEGIPAGPAGRQLSMTINEIRKRSKPWSEWYARMAFRTNVNTAVTAGRFRQARDPDIREVTPAFRFDAVGDSDTRSNHLAADGVILKVNNPAWNILAPPLGYQCRCQVSPVSRPMLRRLGRLTGDGDVIESRVPVAAAPDQDFRHGGRPDLFISEAS